MSVLGRLKGLWTRLRFATPPAEAILIFDRSGLNWLEKSVLQGLKFTVLETRFEVYYLTPAVVLGTLAAIRHLPWRYLWAVRFHPRRVRGMLYMIYLLSCVSVLRPKVVVTFTDNDWKFQMISRIYFDAEFFAIQNGVRSKFNLLYDTPPAPHPANKISMPHLFCFGEVEPETYREYGHQVDHFHPVGSIKAGYYFSVLAPQRPEIAFDICVVSQWTSAVMLGTAYPEIKRSLEIMDGYLARYVNEHSRSLCVALRESHPEEIAYYKRHYAGAAKLIAQDAGAMSTYVAMDQSAVTIVLDSTAGREAYGAEKKVLFCNFTGHCMYDTPAHTVSFVNEGSYDSFRETLTVLLWMNQQEYRAITQIQAAYLMTGNDAAPAYLTARKLILDAVGS